MAGPVAIEFRITGPGGADLEFKVGGQGFVARGVSYTTDVLGDLIRSAIEIATGGPRARAFFDREPAEWRLVLNSLLDSNTGLGPVQIRILEFENVSIERPDSEGHEVFKADCGALEFSAAVLAMAEKAEPGFEQFGQKHLGFPLAALQALKGALGTYPHLKPPV